MNLDYSLKNEFIYFKPLTNEHIEKGWLKWVNDKNHTLYTESNDIYTKEDLIKYLDKSQPPEAYFFAIYDKKLNAYVGNIKLDKINYEKGTAWYGRLIGKEYTGMGVGTQALILLSDFALNFLGLKKIQTGVDVRNLSSVKSNLRSGASLDRVDIDYVLPDGKVITRYVFSFFKN